MPHTKNPASTNLPALKKLDELIECLAKLVQEIGVPHKLFAFIPNMLAVLQIANDKSAIEREVASRYQAIKKLPAFEQLSRNKNFTSALQCFSESGSRSVIDEVRFVMRAVFYIHRYVIETDRPELIRQPVARTRDQAAAAARKLRQLAKKGACLENLQDRAELDTLLARLTSQMEEKVEKRPRNDETQAQRLFVKRLAEDYISRFGEPFTTALKSLSVVIGYEPNDRNIERIVSEARKKQKRRYREALASALLRY